MEFRPIGLQVWYLLCVSDSSWVPVCVLSLVQARLPGKLYEMAPTQLGFGVKKDTEAAAHAAQCFLRDLRPGQVLLKLDFTNAFNTLWRHEILRTAAQEITELHTFVSTCYFEPTHLCFGNYTPSYEKVLSKETHSARCNTVLHLGNWQHLWNQSLTCGTSMTEHWAAT